MAVTVTRRMISTITETAWWTKSNSGTSLPRAARQQRPAHGGEQFADRADLLASPRRQADPHEQRVEAGARPGAVEEGGDHRRQRDQQDQQQEHREQLVVEVETRRVDVDRHVHRRLADQQAGDQPRQDQQGEQRIGQAPGRLAVVEAGGAEPFGENQRAGAGQQDRRAVAGHVAGSEGGLAAILGDFQAVGVDRDVLGGGGERHQQGQADQPGQVALRIAQGPCRAVPGRSAPARTPARNGAGRDGRRRAGATGRASATRPT